MAARSQAMKRVRIGNRTRLGFVLVVVLGVGATVIGCGADGGVGVTEERDLGGFIVPESPTGTQDLAVAPGPVLDLSTTTITPPATQDLSTPSSGGCGSVDTNGICSGKTLEYCNSSNALVTKDCGASSKVCTVSSAGYASCTTP
jgi:hypothetical protein